MKTSIIIRYLAQTLYWFNFILYLSWLFSYSDIIWILLLMTSLIVLCGFVCRLPKNRFVSVLLHTVIFMIPIIFKAWADVSVIALIMGIFMIVCSIISKCGGLSTMSGASLFGKIVLVTIYAFGSALNYRYMVLLFVSIFVFCILEFLQSNFEKNESYIDSLCDTAIVDIKKTKGMANLMTVLSSVIMGIICGLISLLGRIPPAAALSKWLSDKFSKRLSAIREALTRPFSGGVVYNNQDNVQGEIPSEQYSEMTGNSVERTIFTIIAVVAVSAVIICGIYLLIKKIYKYYLKLQHTGYMDEEISVTKKTPKKERKINPRELDRSYSNRRALRRIYKKRIKGRKTGRRDDFINRTPYEQRDRKISEGSNISTGFVDLYEKARYSNQDISKEDVRTMSKME